MSEVKGKTPHGEMTIDQLAGIQPGMARLMREVSERYYYAYYAAKGGNWKLSAHQMNQLRGAFRIAKVTRPKYARDLEEYDSAYVVPVLKAIQAKDWKAFQEAYRRGMEGSDVYHDKYGYGYIKAVLPGTPPSDLYLGPPEKFSRNKKGTNV